MRNQAIHRACFGPPVMIEINRVCGGIARISAANATVGVNGRSF